MPLSTYIMFKSALHAILNSVEFRTIFQLVKGHSYKNWNFIQQFLTNLTHCRLMRDLPVVKDGVKYHYIFNIIINHFKYANIPFCFSLSLTTHLYHLPHPPKPHYHNNPHTREICKLPLHY